MDRRDAEARARPADAAGLLTVSLSPTTGTEAADTPDDANEAAWEPLAEGTSSITEQAWNSLSLTAKVIRCHKPRHLQVMSQLTSTSSGLR